MPLRLQRVLFPCALLLGSFLAAIAAWHLHFWISGLNPWDFIGDYLVEADTALKLGMDGEVLSMYSSEPPPLMMPLALLVRLLGLVPAEWLGLVTTEGAHRRGLPYNPLIMQRYQVGAITALAFATSAAAVAALSQTVGWRQKLGALLFTVAFLLNPLTDDALKWGHPEEILGAGFLFAAIACFCKERWLWAAALIGAAIAVKQPFWLLAPTLVFVLPRAVRVRGLLVAGAVATVFILPFLLPYVAEIITDQATQIAAVEDHDFPISIWYGLGLEEFTRWGRPLIISLALLLPIILAARARWTLTALQGAACMTIILIFRSVADPYNNDYYMLPGMVALLGLELMLWMQNKHPLNIGPLRRLAVPLPFFALLFSGLLSAASFGWLRDALRWAQLGEINGAVYVLLAFSAIFFAAPAALDKVIHINRSRALLYGGAAAAALLLLGTAAYTGRSSLTDESVFTPPGYVAGSLEQTQAAAPGIVYWLGDKDIRANRLRLAARKKNYSTEIVALIDYGRNDNLDGLSVFSAPPQSDLAKKLPLTIKTCRSERKQKCPRIIETPAGPAAIVYTPDPRKDVFRGWEASVLTSTGAVYLAATTDMKPAEVLAKLQPLTAEEAFRGDKSTPRLREKPSGGPIKLDTIK